MLFVIDPLTTLNPCHDSSVAIIEAAQRRHHEVWVTTAQRLFVAKGRPWARARPLQVTPIRRAGGTWVAEPAWCDPGSAASIPLDDCDVVWMRTDPPVDDDYLAATFILDLADADRTLVINRPDGLRDANEKMFGLRFPDLMPETFVSARITDLTAFVDEHTQVVLKPMQGMAGRGILLLRQGDPNLRSILESATNRGRHHVGLQVYLPACADGDRRLIVMGGEPLGVIRRIASADDFRCNMAAGAAVQPDQVTDADRALVSRISPTLLDHGLYFVGLDVIGGYLTEVNVTSPTGIREIDLLNDQDLGNDIVEWAECRVGHRLLA